MQKAKSFVGEGKSLKRPVQEVRAEIRHYIRNERDTVSKKWMALKETIHSEDYRRDQFFQKKFIEDTKSLPINVLKFIGTVKKAVRATMRDKGGTPYSIVRSLFIYWDADRSGLVSSNELLACMKSLGVKISMEECLEIVTYYRPKQHTVSRSSEPEMDYRELLSDIQRGEPTIVQMVSHEDDLARDNTELRFEEIGDNRTARPAVVDRFLEAVRQYLAVKMRNEGGTPQQHIRYLFAFYDYDYSNGLDYRELCIASRRGMNLTISEDQARVIVDYFDRKHTGQMTYDKFVLEVCADVKPILYFTEYTKEQIEEKKKSLERNPFLPKTFAAMPNKILEKFKSDVRRIVIARVNKTGGSMGSWIREAFSIWDRHFSGVIDDPRILQGVAKRLGVTISEDDARIIMKCYDPQNKGIMNYNHFIHEMGSEDEHFLNDGTNKLGFSRFSGPYDSSKMTATTTGIAAANNTTITAEPETVTPSARTPSSVNILLNRMKRAIQAFITKSKGKLSNPVDILHGTFIRFDSNKTGKMDDEGFQNVLLDLKVKYDTTMIYETIQWFDTNASNTMDYNLLIKQIFGDDYLLNSFSLMDYQNKLKQLKQQRKQQLKNIDYLHKCDNTVKIIQNPNHSLGETEIKHPKHLPNHPHYRHRPHSSNAVTNLLSTIAMNRSKTMTSLPTNDLLRPSTAGGRIADHTRILDDPAALSRSLPANTNFVGAVKYHVPSKFVTDTASSQAGSLLLDPSTVTNNPYVTTLTEQNLTLPTEYGVRPEVKIRNMNKQEGINEITQQIKQNRRQMVQEKKKLEKKLLLVEDQRKQLMDEFRSKHSKEAVKTLIHNLHQSSKRGTPLANLTSQAPLEPLPAATTVAVGGSKNQSKPPTPLASTAELSATN